MKGDPIRETQRLSVKLRLLTNTYVLQSKKMKFCDSEKSALCKLCNEHIEDQEHFLLKCEILDSVRTRILYCITQLILEDTGKSFYSENFENQQIILLNLSSTQILTSLSLETRDNITFHLRRLCSALHVERFKLLQVKGLTAVK